MACIQRLFVQGVLRWFAAETQGEQARPAKIGIDFPRDPYKAGVSGPNKTIVGRGVTEEKWPGPESLVTITCAR